MQLVVGAMLVDDLDVPTRLLAAQRTAERDVPVAAGPDGRLPLWEFPGGKVEPGETPRAALARELAEELGVVVELGDELEPPDRPTWPINHRYELRIFLARLAPGSAPPDPQRAPDPSHQQVRWLGVEEIPDWPWLPTNRVPACLMADRMRWS